MKKISYFGLTMSLILILTGCGQKPADEQVKEGIDKYFALTNYSNALYATLHLDAPEIEAYGIGTDFYISEQSDFIGDKFRSDVSVELNGLTIDVSAWGTQELFYVDVPFIGSTMVYDSAEIAEYLGKTEEEMKSQSDLQEKLMKDLMAEVSLKEIFIFDDPLKESITISEKSLNTTKIRAVPNDDNAKMVTEKILNLILDEGDNLFLTAMANGEADLESLKEELIKTRDDMVNMTDEDFNETYLNPAKEILTNFEITFYISDHNIMRTNIEMTLTYEGNAISLSLNSDLINIGGVQDFVIEVPEESYPLTDFLEGYN